MSAEERRSLIAAPVIQEHRKIRKLQDGEAKPLVEHLVADKWEALQAKGLPPYAGEDSAEIDALRLEVANKIEEHKLPMTERKMGIYNQIAAWQSGKVQGVGPWHDKEIPLLCRELNGQLDELIGGFDKWLPKKCDAFLDNYYAKKSSTEPQSIFEFAASNEVYGFIKELSPAAAAKFVERKAVEEYGMKFLQSSPNLALRDPRDTA